MIDYILKRYFEHRWSSLNGQVMSFSKTQEKVLHDIVSKNISTLYLKSYGIRTSSDYRRSCPLSSYDEIEDAILTLKNKKSANTLTRHHIKAFAKSSGTTSRSKYIPYTEDYLETNFDAGKDILALYLHHNPNSKIIGGKNFSLTGSYTIENGYVIGDVSSLFTYYLQPWYRPFRTPSLQEATIFDWEEKLSVWTRILSREDVRWIAGVPSWMKLVIESIESHTQKPIMDIWKNLEVFFYGGVSITPFQEYFHAKFHNRVHLWQTYNASEGFFGIQYTADSSSLALLPVNGIYFEFIAQNEIEELHPCILSSEELEVGQVYEMVITTISGLYRYRMGDLICVDSITPLLISVVGRTKSHINVWGEELMVHNTEEAVRRFNLQSDARILEYTVAPIVLDNTQGYHRWLIEIDSIESKWNHANQLDTLLCELNSDYAAKRAYDLILLPLQLEIVPRGYFHQYLKKENRETVQAKIPKLWKDTSIQEKIKQQLLFFLGLTFFTHFINNL